MTQEQVMDLNTIGGASFMLFILFILHVNEHYRLINYLYYLIYNYNIMI